MKRIFLLVMVFVFALQVTAFAHSIPEGFCGYSWGTPQKEMPESTFVMLAAGKAAIYSINNVHDFDYQFLLPKGIEPSDVKVLFAGDKFFQAQLELERKDAEKVRQYLNSLYGKTDNIYKNEGRKFGEYWIRYIWENDLSCISLTLSSAGNSVRMEVSDELYIKSVP